MTDRCRRRECGRPLTDPTSQARGYGPVCYRREFGHGPRLVPMTAPPRTAKDVPLFNLPDAVRVAEEKPTPGARRIARQAAEIERGYHPLGVALRVHIPLHPDAPRGDDRKAPGPRCGTCVHRVIPLREVAGAYPKCNYSSSGRAWERASGGPGTDCRAWWPACQAYQPKEGTQGE